MTFTERYTWAGLILSIATFAAYWIVIVIRAASDGLPFAEVAWQGPMLWALILGGGLYALAMLVLWIRVRGEAHTDARDHEIERYAATAGNGITGVAVLATLAMLALAAPLFWTATVLFAGSFLGSVVSTGATLSAYRRGF